MLDGLLDDCGCWSYAAEKAIPEVGVSDRQAEALVPRASKSIRATVLAMRVIDRLGLGALLREPGL
jgi:hypothetical protein